MKTKRIRASKTSKTAFTWGRLRRAARWAGAALFCFFLSPLFGLFLMFLECIVCCGIGFETCSNFSLELLTFWTMFFVFFLKKKRPALVVKNNGCSFASSISLPIRANHLAALSAMCMTAVTFDSLSSKRYQISKCFNYVQLKKGDLIENKFDSRNETKPEFNPKREWYKEGGRIKNRGNLTREVFFGSEQNFIRAPDIKRDIDLRRDRSQQRHWFKKRDWFKKRSANERGIGLKERPLPKNPTS